MSANAQTVILAQQLMLNHDVRTHTTQHLHAVPEQRTLKHHLCLYPCFTMAVRITERIALSIGDEKPSLVPEKHVVELNGVKYLKIATWCNNIVSVASRGSADTEDNKKVSLAGSVGFDELKSLRAEAVVALTKEATDDLFGVDPATAKKRVKKSKTTGHVPDAVAIQINGVSVMMLYPRRDSSDLHVQLDETQLEAVFGFVKDKGIDTGTKRSYKKSGRFSKRNQKDAELSDSS